MTDVFISYASADRERAREVADELQSRGLSVWWDRVIPPGRQFDEVIEEALEGARCVVLLWSPAAAASSWVKTEGAEAMRRTALVPALLAPEVRIPLEFRRVQAADLSGWRPGEPSEAFDHFHAAVEDVVRGARSGPAPAPRQAPPRPPPPRPPAAAGSGRWKWAAGAAGALVLGYSLLSDFDIADADPLLPLVGVPAADAELATVPAAAIDQPLRWRDYVIGYEGRLRWDGRSALAALTLRAVDSGNGRVVAEGAFTPAMVVDAPGRIVFALQVPVPGDTRTAGAHTHAVHLVFEQQAGGAWLFRRNCMAPGRPDLCFESDGAAAAAN